MSFVLLRMCSRLRNAFMDRSWFTVLFFLPWHKFVFGNSEFETVRRRVQPFCVDANAGVLDWSAKQF